MAGWTYATLTTAIGNYTEVGTGDLTATITNQFIENAEFRMLRDVPIDADRKQQSGSLVSGQQTINCPAGCLFTRGIQVYTSTSVITGTNVWLVKRDQTFLNEYIPANTSTGNIKNIERSWFGIFTPRFAFSPTKLKIKKEPKKAPIISAVK